jgi:hypothetical protein
VSQSTFNPVVGDSGLSVASFLGQNSSFTNVGLLNIRSLVKHSNEIRMLMRGGGFSLFGYTFLFNNRPKRRGGGVGFFVHKDYRASLVVKSK